MSEIGKRRFCTRDDKACGDQYCNHKPGKESCAFEYNEALIPENAQYRGDQWPPPARWWGPTGALIYRTYSDYLDG